VSQQKKVGETASNVVNRLVHPRFNPEAEERGSYEIYAGPRGSANNPEGGVGPFTKNAGGLVKEKAPWGSKFLNQKGQRDWGNCRGGQKTGSL